MAGAAGVRAGRAFIVIDAVDRTAATLDRIGGRLRAFSARVMSIGRNLSMTSITLMAPLVVATKAFTDFDDAMKRVEARSKGTDEQMLAVRKQAKAIGAETVFAANEIGNLQAKIAQKGFNREQIVQMTPAITDLAIAAGEGADRMQDAEDAALLTTGTLRAFRLEADQTGRVADVMSYAVNNSNFTMRALITALEYAGPVAADYGASLEEVVTALAQMANLNIHPSIAGTSLRNMYLMMSRADEVDKFNRKLSDLTGTMVKIEASADGKFHLPEVLFDLGEAMKDLDPLKKGNLLHDLIGLRPMQAGIALSRGKNPFQNFLGDMLDSTGSGQYVEKTRKKMDEGIGGAFRRLKGAVEDLSMTLGSTLERVLISLTSVLGRYINSLSEWIEANHKAIVLFATVTTATLAFGVALILTGLAIRVFSAGLTTIASIAMFVSGSIRLLTSSLIGLSMMIGRVTVVSIISLTRVFTSLAVSVATSVASMSAQIMSLVAQITVQLSQALISFSVTVATTMARVTMTVLAQITLMINGLTILIAYLIGSFPVWGLWAIGITAAIGALVVFGVVIARIYRSMQSMSDQVTEVKSNLSPEGPTWFDQVLDSINNLVSQGGQALEAFIDGVVVGFTMMYDEVVNRLKGMLDIALLTFRGIASALSQGEFKKAFEVGLLGLEIVWLQLWDNMLDIVETALDAMRTKWLEFRQILHDIRLHAGILGGVALNAAGIPVDFRDIADNIGDRPDDFNPFAGAANAARQKRIEELQKKLDNDVQNIEAGELGIKWHAGDEDEDTAVFKWDPMLANDLLQAGLSSVVPEANVGVYKDSMEAARAFQENKSAENLDALVKGQAQGNDLQADANDLLADIKMDLSKLNVQAV